LGENHLAYPEPIPAIKGKDSEKFLERLRDFKLSGAQRRLFKEGFVAFSHSEGKNRRKD